MHADLREQNAEPEVEPGTEVHFGETEDYGTYVADYDKTDGFALLNAIHTGVQTESSERTAARSSPAATR